MKLTVRDAARVLAVSESQIYRWVEAGEIPCYLVSHRPLFSPAELLEWATARRLPVSTELFETGDEDNGARPPVLPKHWNGAEFTMAWAAAIATRSCGR